MWNNPYPIAFLQLHLEQNYVINNALAMEKTLPHKLLDGFIHSNVEQTVGGQTHILLV